MQRVIIRSRIGNVSLEILGVTFTIASSALLVYYIISNWGANSLVDRVLQLMLLAGAVTGVLFVNIGRANLREQTR